MKWPVIILLLVISSNCAHAQLAHTGAPCQTIQTLKKEHPSSRIYYETVQGQKCYHVHVSHQTGNSVNSRITPWGVSSVHRMNKNDDVLLYWSMPMMDNFYEAYTRSY